MVEPGAKFELAYSDNAPYLIQGQIGAIVSSSVGAHIQIYLAKEESLVQA